MAGNRRSLDNLAGGDLASAAGSGSGSGSGLPPRRQSSHHRGRNRRQVAAGINPIELDQNDDSKIDGDPAAPHAYGALQPARSLVANGDSGGNDSDEANVISLEDDDLGSHSRKDSALNPGAIVRSNMQFADNLHILENLNAAIKVDYEFLPEDMLLHAFTFLGDRDLCTLASVSKSMRLTAYAPFLWPKLDLTSYSYGVHDGLIKHILDSSSRFREITTLSLEACNAVTSKTLELVSKNCPRLRTALFSECTRLEPDAIRRFVNALPYLRKIELYRCQLDIILVDQLREIRPTLDVGFAIFLYCARHSYKLPERFARGQRERWNELRQQQERRGNDNDVAQEHLAIDMPRAESSGDRASERNGGSASPAVVSGLDDDLKLGDLSEDSHVPFLADDDRADRANSSGSADDPNNVNAPPRFEAATCRYEDNFQDQGCWGRVRGRIVYSNQEYHRAGNYPSELLFSCRNHRNLDAKQEEFNQCDVCERLFRDDSMWSEIICRVCYDMKILHDKRNWTPLSERAINDFSFGDLVDKTLSMADRRNLPNSLRKLGSIHCDLDFAYVYDHSELEHDDAVPYKIFWEGNEARVYDHLHDVKTFLRDAKKNHSTRALFAYGDNDETLVYADRGVIVEGDFGSELLHLAIECLGQFYSIMAPILFVLIFTAYLSTVVSDVLLNSSIGRPSPIFIPEFQDDNGALLLVLITLGIIVAIAIWGVIVWRLREQCERFLSKLLIVHLFFLITFPLGVIFVFLIFHYRIPADAVTFAVAMFNVGVLGFISFYEACPNVLPKIIINSLCIAIAGLIAGAIGWPVVFFVLAGSFGDIAAMLRPHQQIFTPFILPHSIDFQLTRPRVFYEVGNLRVRSPDFLMFGLMIGFISIVAIDLTLTMIVILATVVLCVFVLPLFSKNVRPLPYALLFAVVTAFLASRIVRPLLLGAFPWSFVHVR